MNREISNCVIAVVGKDSLHRKWIKDSEHRNFDLHLIVYDDSFSRYEGDTPFVCQSTGHKLKLVYEYLMLHADYMEKYDFFFIPDDDVCMTAQQISGFFELMDRYGLKIAQPSLTESYFTFKHTLQDRRFKLRYTDFVEMMVPCFSREALRKVLFTFNENRSGWGTEYHWASLIGSSRTDMAIIDEIAVRHVRPIQSWTRKNFDEMQDYLKKYGLSRQIHVYSFILSEQAGMRYRGGTEKQVVLLATHFYDEEHILRKYERLKKELNPDVYDVVLLYNTDDKREMFRIPEYVDVCIYDLHDINSLHYEPILEDMLPGSCHFPVLKFYKEHPYYSYYWFIEYDVDFTASWDKFMGAFNDKDYDFISSYVEKYDLQRNGGWHWWNRYNNVGYPLEKCVKAFNPVCRYSAGALEYIDRYQSEGHSAHSELLITTCLYNAGFKVADFGGRGDFVDSGNVDRFYIDNGNPACKTMRYRPVYTEEELSGELEQGKLYHPVKMQNILNLNC